MASIFKRKKECPSKPYSWCWKSISEFSPLVIVQRTCPNRANRANNVVAHFSMSKGVQILFYDVFETFVGLTVSNCVCMRIAILNVFLFIKIV